MGPNFNPQNQTPNNVWDKSSLNFYLINIFTNTKLLHDDIHKIMMK